MNTERIIWTYWVSRDSVRGEPVQTCSIWSEKPRRKERKGRCVTWTNANEAVESRFGDYTLDETRRFCGTVPDDDNQLIKVEQYARPTEQAPQTKRVRRRR